MSNHDSELTLEQQDVLSRLPTPLESTDLFKTVAEQSIKLPVLVVLDDDPTGTQTCHDINVLAVWDHETLLEEFRSGSRGLFILTNSRALPTPEARELIATICIAVKEAARASDREFEIVLRGDSTLRGHFPDEPEVAEEVCGQADAWILAPFFRQGGRLTIDDIHYVASPDGKLVPAAQTPFAKDATFGYAHSNLRDYVVEKSKGKITADRVQSVSLEDIRVGGPSRVAELLISSPKGSIIIANAVVDTDMEGFVLGVLKAQTQGKRYIYRTGAAFVSTRLDIEQIPPLSPSDLKMNLSPNAPGGLIIAGSYVPKTTAQLESLISGRAEKLYRIELDVEALLRSAETSQQTILDATNEAGRRILNGEDVLIMTSRKLIAGSDEVSSLKIGSVIASALVLFLRMLIPRPRYIIAKGGITSSDAATKSLGFRRARVRGQAASGVPLWQCTEESSKYPGITYVVFPGNVGEDTTLRDLVASWEKPEVPPARRPAMEYQRLGSSGLKISRIVLGCMTFGNPDWEGSPWVLSEQDALPLLKKAYDVGINTWETADTYSNGQSESIVGKALQVYNIPRSKIVIMTKLFYPVLEDTPNARPQPVHNDGALVNQMGLSRKHIFDAVNASLRRLGTTYIDVLQLHRLDQETSAEEIMGALHDLVKAGTVHYLGASSMYTWQFARLQYTAKMRGWTPFISMSGLYNLLYREEEREMNPFCNAEGIGLTPWSPIARGLLTRPFAKQTERGQQDKKAKKWFQGRQNEEIVNRVEALAAKKGCSMSSLAIAWLLHKNACPIVGLNSIARIEAASEALSVDLTAEEIHHLEELYCPLKVQAI